MIHNLKIKIDNDFQIPDNQSDGKGKHCFMYPCSDDLKYKFGLENKKVALKIFHTIPYKDGDDIKKLLWGDNPTGSNPKRNTTLLEATQIQNLVHFEGYAPRVYALISVEWKGKGYVAQLTDDLTGEKFEDKHEDVYQLYDKVVINQLGTKYGYGVDKRDVSKWDKMGNQLVDFQTFQFNDDYAVKIKEAYKEGTKWGKIYYHAVPELGLSRGPRVMDKRLEEMDFDSIDFKGKTVLDIGCSGGIFVREALDRGARKAVGIDFPACARGARLASNFTGHYEADFHGMDLIGRKMNTNLIRKTTGIEKFDIVMYLSMFRHVHFPAFVWEMCGETAIIEWNNWMGEKEIRDLVLTKFDITREGRATDHGTGKPFYICKPKQ